MLFSEAFARFEHSNFPALVQACTQYKFYDCYQHMYVPRPRECPHQFRDRVAAAAKEARHVRTMEWPFKLRFNTLKNSHLFRIAMDLGMDLAAFVVPDYVRR